MSSENQLFPPGVMFRSFLLVSGAYVLNIVLLGASGLILASVFFPDSMAILNSDPERFNQVLETEPDQVFPPAMLWCLLAISAAVCFGMGNIVARLAFIGKFSHVIFFSAILFVHYLQLAIGADDSLQTMMILFMAVSPISAILGANFYLKNTSNKETSPD